MFSHVIQVQGPLVPAPEYPTYLQPFAKRFALGHVVGNWVNRSKWNPSLGFVAHQILYLSIAILLCFLYHYGLP